MSQTNHEAFELFTRLESPDAAREERQYASMIGKNFVEPCLVSLLSANSRVQKPISTKFVETYNAAAWQYRTVMFNGTTHSTFELMNKCDDERLLWRECTTTNIPDSLRKRGIIRLPSNDNLALILSEIDNYLPLGNSSFLGAYQNSELAPETVDVSSIEKYNLQFRSRFLMNALLIVAREVIARAPNLADLPVSLINQEGINLSSIDGKDAKLFPNIVLRGSARSQIDAVLLRGSNAQADVFDQRKIFLPNSNIAWDMVNVKALGAYTSVTSEKKIKKPRREDIYQVYGQILKLMHAGISEDGRTISLNYPENLILVYARPFQPLSIIKHPLDHAFWSNFYDDLDEMLILGRISEENRRALIKIYPFITHKVSTEYDKERARQERIKATLDDNEHTFITVYDSDKEWQSSIMPPNFGKKKRNSKSTKS